MKKILITTALMLTVGLSAGVYAGTTSYPMNGGTNWDVTITNQTGHTIYVNASNPQKWDWLFFIKNNQSQLIQPGKTKTFIGESLLNPNTYPIYPGVEYQTFGISSSKPTPEKIKQGYISGTGFMLFESALNKTPSDGQLIGKLGKINHPKSINSVQKYITYTGIYKPSKINTVAGIVSNNSKFNISDIKWTNSSNSTSNSNSGFGIAKVSFDVTSNGSL